MDILDREEDCYNELCDLRREYKVEEKVKDTREHFIKFTEEEQKKATKVEKAIY